MPRRIVSQNVGISPQEELLIMIFLGMVRSTMNWLYFTWDGNVQNVWNLPGPSPSFSAEYHFDYWLKTILSFVVLFRNFATHFHLLFYVLMLYPVFTGEQHRLMLPWLHLQLLKNIVADIICTVIGVFLSWLIHSRGLLTLEFLLVRIISMMPSIYLWRRLRSYYFDLYYAELDGESSLPAFEPDMRLTLAQRRKAAKSLDGTMIAATSSEDRTRINSCLTYEEMFGLQDWNIDTDRKISRSLTTLLTIESHESDNIIERNSRLNIIHDSNLTPAEKTMKILGITEENSDTFAHQLNKKTSTTDVAESCTDTPESITDVDLKFSFVLVTRELNETSAVGTQVPFPVALKKCACCEEFKCSGNDDNHDNDDEDSDERNIETTSEIVTTSRSPSVEKEARKVKPSNCCNDNRKGENKEYEMQYCRGKSNDADRSGERTLVKHGIESSKVVTSFTYPEKDLCPIPRLQAIVERDGIVWEKLKEINFVSVIDKILRDEVKLFKLRNGYSNYEKSGEGVISSLKHFSEDGNLSTDCNGRKVKCESSESLRGILAERKDGSKFIEKPSEFSVPEKKKKAFYLPTSASFGLSPDTSTLNASYVFDETPVSGIQSFDSTSVPTNSLAQLNQDVDFDSYFNRSSFKEHSNKEHHSEVEFSSFQYNSDSQNYGTAYMVDDYSRSYKMDEILDEPGVIQNDAMIRTSSYDSSELSRPIMATKGKENSSGFVYHRSMNHTPQFQHGHHDSRDFREEDVPKNNSSIHPRTGYQKSNRVCRTATMTNDTILNNDTLVKNVQPSNHASVDFCSNFSPEMSMGIEKSATASAALNDLVTSERSASKFNKLASSSRSSRSSRGKKSCGKWEDKTLKALKAYNYKTLYEYKRETDARKCSDVKNISSFSRQRENQSLDHCSGSNFSTQQQRKSSSFEKEDIDPLSLSSSIYRSDFNQALYVPSAPELETPDKELILNIEEAYARFTRSKPSGSVVSGTLYQNIAAKEFFDLYSGGGKVKTESEKMKISEEITRRKQHSKYSKLSRETNRSDITSRSCKQIEGSQKGRELDKILAKENIIAQEIEVYFLERQTDDKPSSSKNLPIKTIKSFSRKRADDNVSVASSETLAPDDDSSQPPMIEVLENSEEIPSRIDENDYYRQLRKNNVPDNVREVMRNIDWSFRQRYRAENNRSKEREPNEIIVSGENRLEHQNIVQKTTENMLQTAFANSEDSERGFRLTESADGYYPIFNEVAITVGEILKAAALRGYRNEFISQPAMEIEIPEINDGNLYGTPNRPDKLSRRSSSRGFLICNTLAEDMQSSNGQSTSKELPSMIVNDDQKKLLESEGREISTNEEGASSVLSRFIVPVESRSAIRSKGLTEPEKIAVEQEDTSGDLPNPGTSDLEDYSKFIFEGSSTVKKSPTSSRCYNPERSIHVGQRTKMSCERVRLALQDVMHTFPTTDRESFLEIPEFLNNEQPQYEFDFESCRRILNHFNTGSEELKNAIEEILQEFPYNENSNSLSKINLDGGFARSLVGSEFITGLEMLSVLNLITTTTDEMINLTENHAGAEESSNSRTEYSSRESNGQSERESSLKGATSQTGTSSMVDSDHARANGSIQSDDLGSKNNRMSMKIRLNDKINVEIESNIKRRLPSSDKIDQPCNDDGKQFLLSAISTVEKIVSPTNLEVLNRENFRREVIDSVFVEMIRGSQSSSRLLSSIEQERVKFETNDTMKRKKFSPLNKEDSIAPESRDLMNIEPERNVHRMGDEFLIDSNNDTPNLVLGDIETMESLIRKMKIVFKQFVTEDEKVEEEGEELKAKKKVSSLTNLSFLVHEEVQKLQRVVQIVANYSTISGSSSEVVSSSGTARSPSEIKSSYELNNSHVRRKELIFDSSENVVKGPGKEKEKSNSEDNRDTKTLRSSRDQTDPVDRFASWDKMIPLSTKRLIAKTRRKSKPKRSTAVHEPPKRIVKVIKLADQKDSDFFSAKFVPQRGRGLSSGYLMDSDSDGNFTTSRPLTPVSIESEISETLSYDNEDSGELRRKRSVKTSGVIAGSKKIQSILCSSSRILIKDSSSLISSMKMINNLDNDLKIEVRKSDEEIKSLKNYCDDDDENIKTDEKLHVLSAEILLTDNELRNLSPVDAVRIINELTNEVKQILIHQFRGVNWLTNGLPVAQKTESFTLLSDSLINIRQSTSCNSVEKIEEENKIKEDCEKIIKEILKDFIDEFIVTCEGDDEIFENCGARSIELLQRKIMISSRDVATGTEYTAAVLKDLIEIFSTKNSTGNNVIEVYGFKNNEIEGTENQNDIQVEKETVKLLERSNADGESLSNYLDDNRLEITSNSIKLDSPLSKSLCENVVAEVNIKEEIIDPVFDVISDNPDEINSVNDVSSNKYISQLEVHSLEPNFASYDSFASLLSQNRETSSEKLSRDISLSDHTFIEEFPVEVHCINESFSQPCQDSDKRSSEPIQSNSQDDVREIDTEERYSKNNNQMTSASSISSESNADRNK